MFSKKSIIVVFAIAQIALSSFAMDQGGLKDLYQQLLKIQGRNDPAESMRTYTLECYSNEAYFNRLLQNAHHTGLIEQYQKILSTEEGSNIVLRMIRPRCLRLAAYMQNHYGGGNVFAYDGGGSEKGAVIGQYMNADNKNLTITKYSFLNGLLDQIDRAAEKLQGNQYFQRIKQELRTNLLAAIADSQVAMVIKNSPPAMFESHLKIIREFGDALIQAGDMKELENLNNTLQKVINDFQ